MTLEEYRSLETDAPVRQPDRDYEEFIVLCQDINDPQNKGEVLVIWPHTQELEAVLPNTPVAWRPLFDDEPRVVNGLLPEICFVKMPYVIRAWHLQHNGVRLDSALVEIARKPGFTGQFSDIPAAKLPEMLEHITQNIDQFILDAEESIK